jgi:hypothetical protein
VTGATLVDQHGISDSLGRAVGSDRATLVEFNMVLEVAHRL